MVPDGKKENELCATHLTGFCTALRILRYGEERYSQYLSSQERLKGLGAAVGQRDLDKIRGQEEFEGVKSK